MVHDGHETVSIPNPVHLHYFLNMRKVFCFPELVGPLISHACLDNAGPPLRKHVLRDFFLFVLLEKNTLHSAFFFMYSRNIVSISFS